MAQERARRIADHMAAEHAAGNAYKPLRGELKPADLEEAYQAQRALVSHWRGGVRGPIAGYKVALTSKPIQELCGVDQPIGGAIFASTVHQGPHEIELSDFGRVGIEFEVCLSLGDDLPGELQPYTAETVREAVQAAVPAFELIDDRNANYGSLDATSMIADNAWSGGVILGEVTGDWRSLELADTPSSLTYNDDVEHANTGAALGNPLISLAWLANLLADQGHPLEKGMIVMTGSALKTRFPEPGDVAVYTVEGLGSVSMTVSA